MSGKDAETVEVDGHRIEITHPDKPMFPDDGIAKRDVADYYRRVAEVALPHYRGRPLSMQRFPDGIGAQGFFQKNAGYYFPDWIETASLEKEDGTVDHVVVNDAATLVYLAQQGMITPHLGLSRVDRIDYPDRLIFDLDPSDDDFGKVQAGASQLRELLEDLGATPFVQASGSRGLHVVVPLDRSERFDPVREAAHGLAEAAAARQPDLLTVEVRKAKRGDRVFVDTLRNAYAQTAVGPYGLRAKPGAPLATPLDWDEALSKKMRPQRFTLANIFRRLGAKGCPWAKLDDAAMKSADFVKAAGKLDR